MDDDWFPAGGRVAVLAEVVAAGVADNGCEHECHWLYPEEDA